MNRLFMSFALAAAAFMVSAACLQANAQGTKIQKYVKVTANDKQAAQDATNSSFHGRAAHIAGAHAAMTKLNAKQQARPSGEALAGFDKSGDDGDHDRHRGILPYFPSDVQYGLGPVLATSTQHAIYVNLVGTVADNWGDPEGYLSDVSDSRFIHITDQYVDSRADDRYPVGGNAEVNITPDNTTVPNEISLTQVFEIAHAAGAVYGTGGAHVYHIFLPKGTNTCIEGGGTPVPCYDPGLGLGNFDFCGYHGWVEFTDIGIVLFTMEPYQNVVGCQEAPPNPNGAVEDSTNGTLGHELFETITDPIGPTGWTNQRNDSNLGAEIGDECEIVANAFGQIPDPSFRINGKLYQSQAEYSNESHWCSDRK